MHGVRVLVRGYLRVRFDLPSSVNFSHISGSCVVRTTGARPAMLRHHPYGWIDRWFDVGDVTRVSTLYELCPCATVSEHRGLTFDSSIVNRTRSQPLANVTALLVCGLFQSWKYASTVEDELRRRLRWKTKIIASVRRYKLYYIIQTRKFHLVLTHPFCTTLWCAFALHFVVNFCCLSSIIVY